MRSAAQLLRFLSRQTTILFRAAAASACLLGLMVLAGWWLNIEFLKRLIHGAVAMNPATAVCFILDGLAFLLLRKWRPVAIVLVILTGLAGASCLLSNLMGWEGGVDHLLFASRLQSEVYELHNRMAPNTAFNFMVMSAAILLLTRPGERRATAAQYLALATLLVSLLSVVGYIYGVRAFYGVLSYIPMAVHTSFGFLLLGGAVLLMTYDRGWMKEFSGPYVGSLVARRLLPAVILVPVLLGLLILTGERYQWYTPRFGAALYTVFSIVVFAYLAWLIQAVMNKADRARTETERKMAALNEELEKRSALLEAANRELESFGYSISHDLKSPLRSIRGLVAILNEDHAPALGPEGIRIAGMMERNARQMNQLIDDLLEFSRFRGKELLREECPMSDLVQQVIDEYVSLMPGKQYAIRREALPSVPADKSMMRQVWANLISNAIKFSAKTERPEIYIGAYREKGEQVYVVKDNGAGFDMAYIHKLFGVFQRLHSDAEFEGTGIGLAIVHRIVTRHGGRVWAESEKGKGAAFYFSLPLPEEDSATKG